MNIEYNAIKFRPLLHNFWTQKTMTIIVAKALKSNV